jgi:hypothetical protein
VATIGYGETPALETLTRERRGPESAGASPWVEALDVARGTPALEKNFGTPEYTCAPIRVFSLPEFWGEKGPSTRAHGDLLGAGSVEQQPLPSTHRRAQMYQGVARAQGTREPSGPWCTAHAQQGHQSLAGIRFRQGLVADRRLPSHRFTVTSASVANGSSRVVDDRGMMSIWCWLAGSATPLHSEYAYLRAHGPGRSDGVQERIMRRQYQ